MGVREAFTNHPKEVGESYSEHLFRTGVAGVTLGLTAVACVAHGVLPFLFKAIDKQVSKVYQDLRSED